MTGIEVEITLDDGTVRRVPCPCDWCDLWRACEADVARAVELHAPPVWPDWLGPPR